MLRNDVHAENVSAKLRELLREKLAVPLGVSGVPRRGSELEKRLYQVADASVPGLGRWQHRVGREDWDSSLERLPSAALLAAGPAHGRARMVPLKTAAFSRCAGRYGPYGAAAGMAVTGASPDQAATSGMYTIANEVWIG